jgi:hypothetical protein
MLTRRSLVTGLISLVAAPAIVRAGSLMPVRQMLVATELLPWAGNFTSGTVSIYGRPEDDTAADLLSTDALLVERYEQYRFSGWGEELISVALPLS